MKCITKNSFLFIVTILVASTSLFTAHHASAEWFWEDPVVLQKTYNMVVIKSQVKTSTVDKSYIDIGTDPELKNAQYIPGHRIYSTDSGVVCEEVDPSVKKKWCIFTFTHVLPKTKYYFATTRENQTLNERGDVRYFVTKETPPDKVVPVKPINLADITGGKPIVAPPDPDDMAPIKINEVALKNNPGLPANCPDGQTSCYQINSGFAALLGDKLNVISSATTLGEFINALLVVIIGIGSILSVFLIMYNGVLFWKNDDNPAKKNVVKKNIINILSGYLLLLCTFIILRTINPDLLNLTPRIDMALLDTGEDGDGGAEPGTDSQQPLDVSNLTSSVCKDGFVTVYNTPICKTIADKFKAMVDAAKGDGITLSASGFRTREQQIALRRKNCGTSDYDIYQKPSTYCSPHTAIPGQSRHESGLALDFMCNGIGFINPGIRTGTLTCFAWMKNNAAKYGFYNYPKEAWHWSIDGR